MIFAEPSVPEFAAMLIGTVVLGIFTAALNELIVQSFKDGRTRIYYSMLFGAAFAATFMTSIYTFSAVWYCMKKRAQRAAPAVTVGLVGEAAIGEAVEDPPDQIELDANNIETIDRERTG